MLLRVVSFKAARAFQQSHTNRSRSNDRIRSRGCFEHRTSNPSLEQENYRPIVESGGYVLDPGRTLRLANAGEYVYAERAYLRCVS